MLWGKRLTEGSTGCWEQQGALREANGDPAFAKALPAHWRGGKLSSLTEFAGEGSQLISLAAPTPCLRFPVSI